MATRHAAERAVEIACTKEGGDKGGKGGKGGKRMQFLPHHAEYNMLVLDQNGKIVPREVPQEYKKKPKAKGLAWLFGSYQSDLRFAKLARLARLYGVEVIAQLRDRNSNNEKPFTESKIEKLKESRIEATTALETAAETHITEISEQLATLFYKEKLNATKQECFRQLCCVTKHNEDTQQAKKARFEAEMEQCKKRFSIF